MIESKIAELENSTNQIRQKFSDLEALCKNQDTARLKQEIESLKTMLADTRNEVNQMKREVYSMCDKD